MSSSLKNTALAALALLVLVLGTLYWRQGQRIAELEASAERALEQTRVVTRRLADTDQRLAQAEKQRVALAAEPSPAPARPAGATRVMNARANAGGGTLDNPNVQRMMASSMKAGLDQRYGILFRQLKLTPGELDKLKDLLTERQMSAMDAMAAARGQGLPMTEMPALMSKLQGEVDQTIRGLLGDERYARYEDYNKNQASYSLLEQIERRLSFTTAPLDATQSAALLRVLAETSPAPLPESGPMRGAAGAVIQSFGGGLLPPGLGGPSITEETVARATGVLTPAQVEVLRQLQAEQQAQATAMQSMRNTISTGGGNVTFSTAAGGGGGMIIQSTTQDFTVGEAAAIPTSPPPTKAP